MYKRDPQDPEAWFDRTPNPSPNDGPTQYSPEEMAEIVSLVRRLGGVPALRALVTAHDIAKAGGAR